MPKLYSTKWGIRFGWDKLENYLIWKSIMGTISFSQTMFIDWVPFLMLIQEDIELLNKYALVK